MEHRSRLSVQPISGALGAEIAGIDLTRPLPPGLVAEIRAALLEHVVIFFRDQDLSPRRLVEVARAFGEPIAYPLVEGLPEEPMVIAVVKEPEDRINFGGAWHSDTSYLEIPPMGTLLHAVEVPPYGGDTLFANQVLAYERLSEGMKRLLDGLVGVNVSDLATAADTRVDMLKTGAKAGSGQRRVARHPVVRTHPETGRKSLYVNVSHTERFDGMTPEESAPILKYLFRHQIRPEFTCRFSWRPGSLAFWDNRTAQHNPINDYHGHRRVMHRVTLQGERPS